MMTSEQLGAFLDPVALLIVVGGTALATMLRTPARELMGAVAALSRLVRPRFSAEPLLEQVSALSRIAQRHGAVALDRSVIADADLAAAIANIVDGCPPAAVERSLRERRAAAIDRDASAAEVWSQAAEAAPAMGMVGTLVGLVAMFTRMTDPAAIGSAMAVALLATLYGAVLANLVLMPVSARLRRLGRIEATERARLEAPLVALANREAPRAPLASVA